MPRGLGAGGLLGGILDAIRPRNTRTVRLPLTRRHQAAAWQEATHERAYDTAFGAPDKHLDVAALPHIQTRIAAWKAQRPDLADRFDAEVTPDLHELARRVYDPTPEAPDVLGGMVDHALTRTRIPGVQEPQDIEGIQASLRELLQFNEPHRLEGGDLTRNTGMAAGLAKSQADRSRSWFDSAVEGPTTKIDLRADRKADAMAARDLAAHNLTSVEGSVEGPGTQGLLPLGADQQRILKLLQEGQIKALLERTADVGEDVTHLNLTDDTGEQVLTPIRARKVLDRLGLYSTASEQAANRIPGAVRDRWRTLSKEAHQRPDSLREYPPGSKVEMEQDLWWKEVAQHLGMHPRKLRSLLQSEAPGHYSLVFPDFSKASRSVDELAQAKWTIREYAKGRLPGSPGMQEEQMRRAQAVLASHTETPPVLPANDELPIAPVIKGVAPVVDRMPQEVRTELGAVRDATEQLPRSALPPGAPRTPLTVDGRPVTNVASADSHEVLQQFEVPNARHGLHQGGAFPHRFERTVVETPSVKSQSLVLGGAEGGVPVQTSTVTEPELNPVWQAKMAALKKRIIQVESITRVREFAQFPYEAQEKLQRELAVLRRAQRLLLHRGSRDRSLVDGPGTVTRQVTSPMGPQATYGVTRQLQEPSQLQAYADGFLPLPPDKQLPLGPEGQHLVSYNPTTGMGRRTQLRGGLVETPVTPEQLAQIQGELRGPGFSVVSGLRSGGQQLAAFRAAKDAGITVTGRAMMRDADNNDLAYISRWEPDLAKTALGKQAREQRARNDPSYKDKTAFTRAQASQRTRDNVAESDGTIILTRYTRGGSPSHEFSRTAVKDPDTGAVTFPKQSRGAASQQTHREAALLGKPVLTLDPMDPGTTPERLAEWILANRVRRLNTEGNRHEHLLTGREEATITRELQQQNREATKAGLGLSEAELNTQILAALDAKRAEVYARSKALWHDAFVLVRKAVAPEAEGTLPAVSFTRTPRPEVRPFPVREDVRSGPNPQNADEAAAALTKRVAHGAQGRAHSLNTLYPEAKRQLATIERAAQEAGLPPGEVLPAHQKAHAKATAIVELLDGSTEPGSALVHSGSPQAPALRQRARDTAVEKLSRFRDLRSSLEDEGIPWTRQEKLEYAELWMHLRELHREGLVGPAESQAANRFWRTPKGEPPIDRAKLPPIAQARPHEDQARIARQASRDLPPGTPEATRARRYVTLADQEQAAAEGLQQRLATEGDRQAGWSEAERAAQRPGAAVPASLTPENQAYLTKVLNHAVEAESRMGPREYGLSEWPARIQALLKKAEAGGSLVKVLIGAALVGGASLLPGLKEKLAGDPDPELNIQEASMGGWLTAGLALSMLGTLLTRRPQNRVRGARPLAPIAAGAEASIAPEFASLQQQRLAPIHEQTVLTRGQQTMANLVDRTIPLKVPLQALDKAGRSGHIPLDRRVDMVTDTELGGVLGRRDILVEDVRPHIDKIEALGMRRPFKAYLDASAVARAWDTTAEKLGGLPGEGALSERMQHARLTGDDALARRLALERETIRKNRTDGTVAPGGLTKAQATRQLALLKAKLTPEQWGALEGAREAMTKANHQVLDALHDEGLLATAQYKVLKERDAFYAPIRYRRGQFDEASGLFMKPARSRAGAIRESQGGKLSVAQEEVVQRLEGAGTRSLNDDPMDAWTDYITEAYKEIGRNKVARVTAKQVELSPLFAYNPKTGTGIKLLKPGSTEPVPDGMGTISWFEGGQAQKALIPAEVAEALNFAHTSDVQGALGAVGTLMGKTRNLLQMLATSGNLVFAVKNIPKDIMDAFYLTPQMGLKDVGAFSRLWVKNVQESARGGPLSPMARRFKAAGADYAGMTKNLMPDDIWGIDQSKHSWPVRSAGKLLNATEEATKRTVFELLLKKKGRDGKAMTDLEAAYITREYGGSPDFAKMGRWAPQVRDMVMFFNPQVQGINRTLKAYRNNPERLMWLAAGTTMAIGAVHQWNSQFVNEDTGRPEIEDVSENDRNNNIVILLSGPKERNRQGQLRQPYIRIPIGHAAKLLYNPIQDLFRAGSGDPSVRLDEAVATELGNVLPGSLKYDPEHPVKSVLASSVGSLNPLVKVPFEQIANVNSFTQAPIVGRRIEQLPAHEQATDQTSPTFRNLGQLANQVGLGGIASPVRMEAAFRAGIPGIGEQALAVADSFQTKKPQPVQTFAEARGSGIAGPFWRPFLGTPTSQVREDTANALYGALAESGALVTRMSQARREGDVDTVRQLQASPEYQVARKRHARLQDIASQLGAVNTAKLKLKASGHPNVEALLGKLWVKERRLLAEGAAIAGEPSPFEGATP
jgi:Large polyvalent protein associated domain 38